MMIIIPPFFVLFVWYFHNFAIKLIGVYYCGTL